MRRFLFQITVNTSEGRKGVKHRIKEILRGHNIHVELDNMNTSDKPCEVITDRCPFRTLVNGTGADTGAMDKRHSWCAKCGRVRIDKVRRDGTVFRTETVLTPGNKRNPAK